MKHIHYNGQKTLTNSRAIAALSLTLLSLMTSSCTAIAEIFEAGMGFGIFMILAVLVIIVYFIMRLRKK